MQLQGAAKGLGAAVRCMRAADIVFAGLGPSSFGTPVEVLRRFEELESRGLGRWARQAALRHQSLISWFRTDHTAICL